MKKIAFILFAAILAACTENLQPATETAALTTPEVRVSELNSTSFSLEWGIVYGANKYCYTFEDKEGELTERSLTFSDLTPGQEYNVTLRAVCDSLDLPYIESQPVIVNVTTPAIEKLESPQITVGSNYASKTIISWSVVPGAGYYKYSIDGIEGTTAENRVVLTNLKKSTAYTFTLRALPADESQNSASEDVSVDITTSESDVPAMIVIPTDVVSDALAFEVFATNNTTYFYDVVPAYVMHNFTEEQVIDAYKTSIVNYAKSQGISLQLAMAAILKSGSGQYTMTDLISNMSYEVIIFGMDYHGNVTTNLYRLQMKTTEVGYSSGPNFGGASWYKQRFYLSNDYSAILGTDWTNSVWTNLKGRGVRSVRYRLLPTTTFERLFPKPYDHNAIKDFLKDPLYSYELAPSYVELVNTDSGHNSVTQCYPGVSYTMASLATSDADEEVLSVNSITTKVSKENKVWFNLSAMTNEKFGETHNCFAAVMRGVQLKSIRFVAFNTAALEGIPTSAYPKLVADKGRDLTDVHVKAANENGLAILINAEPSTSYTALATAESVVGDIVTVSSTVTTTAAPEGSRVAMQEISQSDIMRDYRVVALDLTIDGHDMGMPVTISDAEPDLWTIIHNMRILETIYENKQ